jgi:hypothetical protein
MVKEGKGASIYYRDYWPNEDKSQDGSNDGKSPEPASLWDIPEGFGVKSWSFETGARCADDMS